MAFSATRLAARLLLAVTWVACCARAVAQPAAPAEPAVTPVALLRVHLPLTGNADQMLKASIRRLRDQLVESAKRTPNVRRPVVVLQLEPHVEGDGTGSQFERVLSLARTLVSRDMASVKTVAFVPRSIRGHGVLLALACEEIVMAPQATLGEAGVDESSEGTISKTVVGAYREIAESRRTMPVALALGMIDPAAEVWQIETEVGTEFVLQRPRAGVDPQQEVLEQKVLVPSGSLASYEGREGRQFGFVKFLAANREGLAQALGVALTAIEEIDMLAGEWQPTIIDLTGPITPRLANQVETMLTTAIEQRMNWIALRIDSSGGDLAASVRIATTLAKLDANAVRTIAYVPAEAKGGAAVVALACDQLIMHPAAQLGVSVAAVAPRAAPEHLPPEGFPILAPNNQAAREAELVAARTAIRESLAPRAERSWSLLTAMIDPGVELLEYRNRATGEMRWMSKDEVASQDNPARWQKGAPLIAADAALVLEGTRVAEANLARQTVESFDELKQLYRLTEDPPVAQPNWALELIEALASPGLAWILLMLGFYGLYIELRTPGVGVGAFVGTVAMLLFFWSQYLHGTAGWLEVLLFVTGLVFIAVEIFVLPGFGIFGLGGGALVIASLILASLTFVRPQSEQDMQELTRAVGMVAIAGAGMVVSALVSRRFLPEAPLFRRIVLAPPQPAERAVLDNREALADYSHLIGQRGIAATHLRPAGKAEIDHQLIDVIAEAEPLDCGTPLEVVDAHANRVVVRATGPA